eukprot:scaffold41534_cov70-Phaeocystis_antarctica.AAC.2
MLPSAERTLPKKAALSFHSARSMSGEMAAARRRSSTAAGVRPMRSASPASAAQSIRKRPSPDALKGIPSITGPLSSPDSRLAQPPPPPRAEVLVASGAYG